MDAQHVRDLDHVDAVDEGFVVLVVLERLPLGFVRVRHDDAGVRDSADILGADVIPFLRRGQQRVQHLDRRFEHLDEFEHALVGAVQTAGVAVRVRIVLRVHFELANIDLADQRTDVLVVVVPRLGFRDRNLAQARWIHFCDAKFGDVAAEFVEPLDAPRTHQTIQAALRNAIIVFKTLAPHSRIEQPQRMLEHRRKLLTRFQHIDRLIFHQRLQALSQRRLAAADRAQKVDNLLALFQTLSGVAEERNDAFDRLFHAVEFSKGRVDPHGAVHKDAPEPRVFRRIDHLRLAYRGEETFMRARVSDGIIAAKA